MRGRGGYIGMNVSATSSSASGVWTLREAESLRRAALWPVGGPAQISTGLRAWLDASDGDTLFSDTAGSTLAAADQGVALWKDKSGNGWNVTQSTSGDRPTRKAAYLNGLGSLLFDGSSDSMAFQSGFAQFGANDFSFVVACKTGSSVAGVQNVLGSQNNSSDPGPILRLEVNAAQWNSVIRYSGWSAFSVLDGPASTNTGYVLSLIRSGLTVTLKAGSSSASFTVSEANTGNASSTLNLNPPLQVGRILFNTGESQWHFNGQIPEIICYSRAISSGERTALESYLSAKWGIS